MSETTQTTQAAPSNDAPSSNNVAIEQLQQALVDAQKKNSDIASRLRYFEQKEEEEQKAQTSSIKADIPLAQEFFTKLSSACEDADVMENSQFEAASKYMGEISNKSYSDLMAAKPLIQVLCHASAKFSKNNPETAQNQDTMKRLLEENQEKDRLLKKAKTDLDDMGMLVKSTRKHHEDTLQELSDIKQRFSEYARPSQPQHVIAGFTAKSMQENSAKITKTKEIADSFDKYAHTTNTSVMNDATNSSTLANVTDTSNTPETLNKSNTINQVVMGASAGSSSGVHDPAPYNPNYSSFSAQVARMSDAVRSIATNPERNSYCMRMYKQKVNTANKDMTDIEKVRLAMQPY